MSPEIVDLVPADAAVLARLLSEAQPSYVRHFHPFPFTVAAVEERLHARVRDRWWGICSEGALAGFFFLRGFDEGYARPSFGVFVAESHSGRGLARLALAHSLAWCRDQAVATVMLKVHPDHTRAREVYESAGFTRRGLCSQTGHEIMEAQPLAKAPPAANAPNVSY